MAVGQLISLGLGSPASVAVFLLVGLSPVSGVGTAVVLISADLYGTSTVTAALTGTTTIGATMTGTTTIAVSLEPQ